MGTSTRRVGAERVVAMTSAAAVYVSDLSRAEEMARNIACALGVDEHTGEHPSPYRVALDAILHRVRHFGLRCTDTHGCAFDMARAWVRA